MHVRYATKRTPEGCSVGERAQAEFPEIDIGEGRRQEGDLARLFLVSACWERTSSQALHSGQSVARCPWQELFTKSAPDHDRAGGRAVAVLVQRSLIPRGAQSVGGVAEVEAEGAVEGVLGAAEGQASGQDIVLVAFVAVGEQGETPHLGVAGVLESAQLQVAFVVAVDDGIDVGVAGAPADLDLGDLGASGRRGGKTLLQGCDLDGVRLAMPPILPDRPPAKAHTTPTTE